MPVCGRALFVSSRAIPTEANTNGRPGARIPDRPAPWIYHGKIIKAENEAHGKQTVGLFVFREGRDHEQPVEKYNQAGGQDRAVACAIAERLRRGTVGDGALGLAARRLVVAAAIIETLGLTTVHTALWLADWNRSKRKIDPSAPVVLAVALGLVYLVATLGLVVFLEVWPFLATYAPALFPLLAIVGAVNLALIAQQERRESHVKTQKAEARERRRLSKTCPRQLSRWTPETLS